MQLRASLIAALSAGGLLAGSTRAAPAAHKLECPATAPADWGVPAARLDQVDVLSMKPGENVDEKAPPALMPDKQSVRSGVLHQTWELRAMAAGGEVQQLWCRYAGSGRILKLPAQRLQRCEQTITHFSTTRTDPQSQRAAFCD
jgi:hypothetical protein